MTAGRRTRPLSFGEKRLWAAIARSVRPLPGRAVPEAEAPSAAPVASSAATAGPAAPPPSRPKVRALPRRAPGEARTRRALARGQMGADATLDLHGYRQTDAHAALLRFLARSQAAGCRLVLVVTGKGRSAEAGGPVEPGVLRRLVPLWLAAPELRRTVLGFEEAAPRRGGAGALYVRLRRAGPRA